MYASRKVTMITWAKEWGPGFPGEGGAQTTLGYRGGGWGQTARGTPDCSPYLVA